jgi:hypothetical protein
MCCDHCNCAIAPGTERIVWDGVKRWARVCTLCVPFVVSIVFGQTSPVQAPPPIIQTGRRVVVDSGSSSTLSGRYWQQQLNGFFVAGQDSDDNPVASLTVPHNGSTPTLPAEEQPNPDNQPHPPHQGSTFLGISGSGAMANTNSAMTVTTWEPPDPGFSSLARLFERQSSARGVMLKVGSVAPQHRPFLPRARRNCPRS